MPDSPHINLDAHVEALLFVTGGPLTISALAKALSKDEDAIEHAIMALKERLKKDSGLTVVRAGDTVQLATNERTSKTVEHIRRRSLEEDIGQAGLEILAILLYSGPSSRAAIDHIRGVNSAFSIRSLMSRGLAERIKNPNDKREFVYRPSIQLMTHLGITDIQDIPEFDTIRSEIANFELQSHGSR